MPSCGKWRVCALSCGPLTRRHDDRADSSHSNSMVPGRRCPPGRMGFPPTSLGHCCGIFCREPLFSLKPLIPRSAHGETTRMGLGMAAERRGLFLRVGSCAAIRLGSFARVALGGGSFSRSCWPRRHRSEQLRLRFRLRRPRVRRDGNGQMAMCAEAGATHCGSLVLCTWLLASHLGRDLWPNVCVRDVRADQLLARHGCNLRSRRLQFHPDALPWRAHSHSDSRSPRTIHRLGDGIAEHWFVNKRPCRSRCRTPSGVCNPDGCARHVQRVDRDRLHIRDRRVPRERSFAVGSLGRRLGSGDGRHLRRRRYWVKDVSSCGASLCSSGARRLRQGVSITVGRTKCGALSLDRHGASICCALADQPALPKQIRHHCTWHVLA